MLSIMWHTKVGRLIKYQPNTNITRWGSRRNERGKEAQCSI